MLPRRSTATSITARTLVSHQPSDVENTDFMNQAACNLRSLWVFTALTQPLHNSYMYFMISLYRTRILPYPAETHHTKLTPRKIIYASDVGGCTHEQKFDESPCLTRHKSLTRQKLRVHAFIRFAANVQDQ